jgi:hypothetical protein
MAIGNLSRASLSSQIGINLARKGADGLHVFALILTQKGHFWK